MQYKAHIPAGIALAATATLVSGQPLDPLMLIGGAIGGALPDIDVSGEDGQGSAVQHLGSKATAAMNQTVVLSPIARLLRPVASVFDMLVLGPVCRLWRLLAQGVLGPAYLAVARSGLGQALRLDTDDPSAHRGGLTHSLLSLALFSLPLFPLLMLLHAGAVWVGIMWGMLSHLICDAFCKSGVKFLWPWVPDIGFRNEDGVGGKEGIKLLPAGVLMKTGKCPSRSELKAHFGSPDFDECKKYYLLEVGWQRFFQVAALVVPLLVLLGVGPASGKVAFAGSTYDLQHKDDAKALQATSSSVDPIDASDPSATTVSEAARVADGRGSRVDEHRGPTSLTYGDLDANTLPGGVAKMPDESLWIPGVGPVNAETLNDPSLMMTDDEKTRLLAAATAQRLSPSNVQQTVSDAVEGAKQGVEQGAEAVQQGVTDVAEQVQENSGGITIGAPGNETHIDLPQQNGVLGFHGLTPFTSEE